MNVKKLLRYLTSTTVTDDMQTDISVIIYDIPVWK